jgi:glycosyltransferase involved in cell wall biosynthesis
LIEHTAFVTGEEKAKVFLEADVLLFPSYYAAEVIPTVILDALAWGLPVVSTKWRGIPELVPDCGLPLCEIQDPESVALRLLDALSFSAFAETREWFEQTFLEQKFLGRLADAIQSVPTLCNREKAKRP